MGLLISLAFASKDALISESAKEALSGLATAGPSSFMAILSSDFMTSRSLEERTFALRLISYLVQKVGLWCSRFFVH